MDSLCVKLLHYTPLFVCSMAIRTCWDSHCKSDNGGQNDKDLIYRIGNIQKHKSTLEHLVYSFEIINISRACLQELARHRVASLSVKSTRYTLKELKNEKSFMGGSEKENKQRAAKYIVMLDSEALNNENLATLERLRILIQENSQDVAKYALPECYKTRLVWSINARSLQNFLELRTSKRALREIRILAFTIYENLPQTHKYLFKDSLSLI